MVCWPRSPGQRAAEAQQDSPRTIERATLTSWPLRTVL